MPYDDVADYCESRGAQVAMPDDEDYNWFLASLATRSVDDYIIRCNRF